jgi:LCP family protein required for cell wall assembly
MTSTRQRSFFDLTVIYGCVFFCLLTMWLDWQSPVAHSIQQGQRIIGLLIGSDYEDYTRHSDTMMVVSYDPQARFLDVMSIPRDTMVSLPNLPHVRRLNEVFAYEWRHSGHNFTITSLALKSTLETLLSSGTVRPLEIPYFFTIDYGGFRSLIDALGGVYVKVTESMNYDDSWGHLHIHFEPGTYLLDGKRALEYVRFRGSSADQGRVRRQQIFIKEVIKRLKNPALLWRLPHYGKIFLAGFHTNVSFWDTVNLLLEGRRVHWNHLRLLTLPGVINGNLWKMDMENTRRVLAMMQAPASLHFQMKVSDDKSSAGWNGKPTVEVWNASKRPNAAREVVTFLREKGFDVVKFGNFSTRQQQTLVVDRSGDLRPAQAVAEALRSVNPDVVSRPQTALQVDVSVIIGNDYLGAEKK